MIGANCHLRRPASPKEKLRHRHDIEKARRLEDHGEHDAERREHGHERTQEQQALEDTLDRVACAQLWGNTGASDEETEYGDRKRECGQRHARITLQAHVFTRRHRGLCRHLRCGDVARDDVAHVVQEQSEAILAE